MVILLNKPYGVLSQFTDGSSVPRRTLSEFGLPPDVYAAGRLDFDSEGLLLLTDDGALAHTLTDPRHKQDKTYWVQVEGTPQEEPLDALRKGVMLSDGLTKPAKVERLEPAPILWARSPPIRVRKSIPDTWLALTIREGRNRQVRRMTAAIGHPTLRLIRSRIGRWSLGDLAPGQWKVEPQAGRVLDFV